MSVTCNMKCKTNLLLVPFFIMVFFTSCQEVDKSNNSPKSSFLPPNDSITLSIEVAAHSVTGLNAWVKPYDEVYIEFRNDSDMDSIIVKKVPLAYKNYFMSQLYFEYDENGKISIGSRYFIANDDNLSFDLVEKGNEIYFRNLDMRNSVSDSIFYKYNKLKSKILRAKGIDTQSLESELESLYRNTAKYTMDDPVNSEINEMLYLDQFQQLYLDDKKVDSFLMESKEVMMGGPQQSLLVRHFKNRVEQIDYEKLDTHSYSPTYVELMSIAAYRFLKQKDNKGRLEYQPAIDWLKTTNFYKRDSLHIRKNITPIDNDSFRSRLINVLLEDTDGNKMVMNEVLEKHPSKYYLIDLWATWCAPCISGFEVLNELSLPSSVKVLKLNVDKSEHKSFWKEKSDELKLDMSYYFDEGNIGNRVFTTFIELKKIPRYILVDRKLNLIDEAFYHPHEPQFIQKLQDIDNHQYW